MDDNQYRALVDKAVTLDQRGDYRGAAAIFEQIVAGDLPDLDKSMACVNLATLHDKLQLTDQALRWYDRAIDYDRGARRVFAAAQKAAYLARLGRRDESRRLYEALLERPDVSEAEREGFRHNVRLLGGSATSPGFSETIRLGSGRVVLTIGGIVLGAVALLWAGHLAGRLPAGPPPLVHGVLGLVAAIGVATLVAGLLMRSERYEVDGTALRRTTAFGTTEVPLHRITDVSWETRFGVLTGQIGLIPLPQIVVWGDGKPELRIGVLPSATYRANLQRLLRALVRVCPAVRLDHTLRQWL